MWYPRGWGLGLRVEHELNDAPHSGPSTGGNLSWLEKFEPRLCAKQTQRTSTIIVRSRTSYVGAYHIACLEVGKCKSKP